MSLNYNPHYSFEEQQQRFIESKIEDFAHAIVKHGVDFKHGAAFEGLIDCLYMHVEDNIETFLPEEDL